MALAVPLSRFASQVGGGSAFFFRRQNFMRGKCLCNAVEFEIIGVVPKLYQCHCSLCRKQGGSTSNTATVVALENFRWLSGQERISSFVLPTGFRSDFCSTCGSTVPNSLRNTPYVWVPAGLFESSEKLEIAVHLYVGSRASWDTVALSGTLHETMPEMLAFIQDLHAYHAF
ncbi:MAG: GFA family protein [Candidatus Competibacteraceae bacterium]